jgi:ankyrin repeat protein
MFYLRKLLYLFVLIGYSVSNAGSYEDFFSALQRDDRLQARAMLQNGFDPNSVDPNGEPALLLALRSGSFAVATELVAHPDIQVELRSNKDESPLMLAAIKGRLDLCRQLIARDADVNKPGWTPLHYAAANSLSEAVEVVRLLLEHFAYIDADSPNGTTPLMMAARYGSYEVVQVLLDAGADPSLKNALGLTALDFAEKVAHTEALESIARAIRARQPEGSW